MQPRNDQQSDRYKSKYAGKNHHQGVEDPLIARRALILAFCFAVWAIFVTLGIWLLVVHRYRHVLLGARIAGVGVLTLWSGLLLEWLSDFPSTWGWWL